MGTKVGLIMRRIEINEQTVNKQILPYIAQANRYIGVFKQQGKQPPNLKMSKNNFVKFRRAAAAKLSSKINEPVQPSDIQLMYGGLLIEEI